MTLCRVNNNVVSFDGEHRWLSNFWPVKIEMDGIIYPSVEHAYQSAKTDDVAIRTVIASTESPGKAKRLAKELIPNNKEWAKVKVWVMFTLLQKKFRYENLRKKLDSTDGLVLIEGNNWGDTFWGVDVRKGGSNMLGKCLMAIRENQTLPPEVIESPFNGFYSGE